MCEHLNTRVEMTGGMYLSQGEPTDDIEEKLLCLDCFEYVEEIKTELDPEGQAIPF